jgi:mRNA interferase RelE/StbE
LVWGIEYTESARGQLHRLDRGIAGRVLDYMEKHVAVLDNPRQRGQALSGRFAGIWSYRVGDVRVICDIQDNVMRVLVVRVGRRDQVYR